MVVNFRARGISRGTCKLVRIPTLIKKYMFKMNIILYYDVARKKNKKSNSFNKMMFILSFIFK